MILWPYRKLIINDVALLSSTNFRKCLTRDELFSSVSCNQPHSPDKESIIVIVYG